MKKALKIILVIFLIIFLKLSFSYAINEIIIYNYNAGKYNNNLVKLLYVFNFHQPYIAYYNEGNILYQKNNYDEAIAKYNEALNKRPPLKRVCDIRINLSLAIIKNININNKTEDLQKLEEAKNNLYENNCANPIDDSGNSKDAEKLEEEINELEKQLEDNSNDSSPDDNNTNGEEENKNTQNIEEKLKEQKKKSNSSRQEDLTTYENMEDYEYYSGKRW